MTDKVTKCVKLQFSPINLHSVTHNGNESLSLLSQNLPNLLKIKL